MEKPNENTTQQQKPTEVKVETKPWSNPTPAGLVALAVACFCFFALLNGFIDNTALPLVGCWLLGGFVVQVIVGLIDLKNGNQTGGNTFIFFSAFFMLVGGLEMIFKYIGIDSGTPLDARVDGYAWLALTIAIYLWTPAFLKDFSLLSLVVLFLDVALPFIVLNDFGFLPADVAVVFKKIAAYALLCAGIVGLYLSSAIIVNSAFGREVYPIIKRRKK